MSFGKYDTETLLSPQPEIDFLKSELEYHLDMIEESIREMSYHTRKAQYIRKELETHATS